MNEFLSYADIRKHREAEYFQSAHPKVSPRLRNSLAVLVDLGSGLIIDTFTCDSDHGIVLRKEPVPYAVPHIASVRKVRYALAL